MSQVHIKKLTTLTGHRDCVYTIYGLPASPVFFSGGGDGMIFQWDSQKTDGELIVQMPDSVYAMHYFSEQDLLLAGLNYDGVHLLDWSKKKEVASLKLTSAAIFDIQLAGSNFLVACGDGSVAVVDTNQLVVRKQLDYSSKSARTISVNQVAGDVAIGYSDNFIRIFRLDDFSMRMEYRAHANSVFTLHYSPDNKWLFSGARDARLKVWNVAENYSLHREIAAHLFAINHIAFSPDGKHFVTCSMDKSIKVWETDSLTLLKVIDKARHAGHGTSVNKLLWSSFNNQLMSASDDKTISVWDVIF